jgi:hypothetical protein
MSAPETSALRLRLVEAGYDLEHLKLFDTPQSVDQAPFEPAPTAGPDAKTLLRAALSGHFLPNEVSGTGAEKESVALGDLLSLSETVVMPHGRAWRLRADVRRQTLLEAHSSGALSSALHDFAAPPGDTAGDILRRALAKELLDPERMPLSDLEPLAQVVEWLAGTSLGGDLPKLAEVRRIQQRRELIEPFLTLVGRSRSNPTDASRDRFVGRETETERLRAYVGIVPPDRLLDYVKRSLNSLWASVGTGSGASEPLLVEGAGGAGKSTLIAKFILDHALIPGLRLPFVYLDFDRATITPREPLQLLIDIALQMAVWLPEADEPLRLFRHELRRRIEQQAHSLAHKDRERLTRSELSGLCQQFRSIVEAVNNGRAPVILLLDTFEIVQYSEEAVEGVRALLDALRQPAGRPWNNLRIVVAGRGKISDLETSLLPLAVGRLTVRATEQLISLRNDLDQLGLTKAQVAALARPLSDSPLDVVTITRWIKQNRDNAAGLIEDILHDPDMAPGSEGSPSEIVEARVSALLMERMIKHIADKHIRRLALPGFVVRAISPDVIREVMIPAGAAYASASEAEKSREVPAERLFTRLERERWLVRRHGPLLRHRPEVRRAMLRLMRRRDRASFFATNEMAIDFFRRRMDEDRTARAEAIYHLLLAEVPRIEEADLLWRPEVGSILAGAVDDLSGPAQDYLRIRLGRSYRLQALVDQSSTVLHSVISSLGSRLLKRLSPDDCLQLLVDRPEVFDIALATGLYAEALYRGGHWNNLIEQGAQDLRYHIATFREWIEAGSSQASPHLFRQFVRLSTRDPSLDRHWAEAVPMLTDMLDRLSDADFWDVAAFIACFNERMPKEASHRLYDIVWGRCMVRPLATDSGNSAALRILALLEPDEHALVLRRVDLKTHLATVNRRELELFRQMVSEASAVDRARLDPAQRDRLHEQLARGRDLLAEAEQRGGGTIFLDPKLTSEVGAIAEAILLSGEPEVSRPVRDLLTLTHPDWLEPLGLALDRAYGGAVPTRLGWFTSIEKLLGEERRSGRGAAKAMSGHQILSLADETGQLLEAVDAYREHMLSQVEDSGSFPYLADRLKEWTLLIDRQLYAS